MTEPKPTYRKRAPGGGRKIKWQGWGRMKRIDQNWPVLIEMALRTEFDSLQEAIDVLVIQRTIDKHNIEQVTNDTRE